MTGMTDHRDLCLAATTQRETALDPFAGLYLEAPADFRRTFLLIARFLRLLSIGDQPGQILALTFTNKPAGEMRKTVPDDDIEQAVSWSVLRRWTPICVEAARVV